MCNVKKIVIKHCFNLILLILLKLDSSALSICLNLKIWYLTLNYSSSQQSSNLNLESSRSSLLLNLHLPYCSQFSAFPREFANDVRKESPEFFRLMIDSARKIEGYKDRYRYVHFLDICRMHYDKANKNQSEFKPKQEERKQDQKADASQIDKANKGKFHLN